MPWEEEKTNSEGRAIIEINHTALDDSPGDVPPAGRDIVAGREYLFQVQIHDESDEILIKMTPGTRSRGEKYTITMESLESPRYVDE